MNQARKRVTQTLVNQLKREAKRRAKNGECSHAQALETLAGSHGFRSWSDLLRNQAQETETAPADIRARMAAEDAKEDAALDLSVPVDPLLPTNFDDTPNEDRSDQELSTWWNRPYAIANTDGTLSVHCLDGGAWDRPTWYGVANNHEEAVKLGKEKLHGWLSCQRREIVTMLEDGTWWLCRSARKPGSELVLIEELAQPKG